MPIKQHKEASLRAWANSDFKWEVGMRLSIGSTVVEVSPDEVLLEDRTTGRRWSFNPVSDAVRVRRGEFGWVTSGTE